MINAPQGAMGQCLQITFHQSEGYSLLKSHYHHFAPSWREVTNAINMNQLRAKLARS